MKRLFSACLIAAAITASCSSDERERAERLQERSVSAEAKPLREALITDAEIQNQPRASAERAFLQYWSLLQYQAWEAGLTSYDAPLQASVGSDRIVEALKTQAAFFRSSRPRMKKSVERNGRVTLRYLVESPSGDLTPGSMTWTRRSDGWQIFYDTFLDEALRQAAQRATQVRVDPTTERTGPEAIRHGDRASRLQSRYLRERLEAELPG